MTPESDDVSLWDQLGLDVHAVLEPLPDDTFARMLETAVDPATPEADPDLLPGADDPLDVDDLDVGPVDPGSLHEHAAHEPDPHGGVTDHHPDLGLDDDSDDADGGSGRHHWHDDSQFGDASFDHHQGDTGADDTFDVGGHDI